MSIVLDGTTGIITPEVTTSGTSSVINGIILGPSVLDPENRIINGAFDFWQRGTSFSAIQYGADRWQNIPIGGTVTMSRQAFAVGETLGSNSPTYFLRQTVSGQSAAGDVALFQQNIEGVRSYAGQTITILGWAKRSSGSGNMVIETEQYFGTGGTPSADVAPVAVETVTLSASWTPFAVTMSIPSITGKTIGTANNDALRVAFWLSAGATNNFKTNSLGIQTIGVDLWGIHIKLGVHTADATALYKQPELGPELTRCQRYYQTIGFGVAQAVVNGYTYGASISFPYMRTVPTYSFIAWHIASNFQTSPNFVEVWYNSALRWTAVATANAYGIASYYAALDAEL